jgi:hypothetical protein
VTVDENESAPSPSSQGQHRTEQDAAIAAEDHGESASLDDRFERLRELQGKDADAVEVAYPRVVRAADPGDRTRLGPDSRWSSSRSNSSRIRLATLKS